MTLRHILSGMLLLFAIAWGFLFWGLDTWRSAHQQSLFPEVPSSDRFSGQAAPGGEALELAVALLGPGDWSELAERPLFLPSRRPYEPEPALEPELESVGPAVHGPLPAVLRSVVIGPGATQVWLQPEGGSRLVKLFRGDRFQGWLLEAIDPQGAAFVNDDGTTQVLPLRPEQSRALEIERVAPRTPPPPLR